MRSQGRGRIRLARLRPHNWAWTASLLLLILSGCATVEQAKVPDIVWPEPPETPRIKFVGVLRTRYDIGRTSSEIFTEALIGPKKVPQSLREPVALVPSPDGKRLYVSDYARGAVFVFDYGAQNTWFLGEPPHGFNRPFGIGVDDQENIYVADSDKKWIRVFDRSGKFLRNITHASVERPTGLAVDAARRRIYLVDSSRQGSQNHVVHIFNLDGTYVKSFGGTGRGEGQFYFPTYAGLDGDGNVYVTDTMNARVQVFDSEGRFLRSFGKRGDGLGMFNMAKGVATDTFGNIYAVDSAWSNVQIFNKQAELLMFFGGRGTYPGLLNNPTAIAIDRNNRIYVADTQNGRIGIYQLINTKAEDSFKAAAPESGSEVNPIQKGGESVAAGKGKGVEKTVADNQPGNERRR